VHKINHPGRMVGHEPSGIDSMNSSHVAGLVDDALSRFTIDQATLESDSDRRDDFLRRNTHDIANHPAMILLARSMEGLPNPLPMAPSKSSGSRSPGWVRCSALPTRFTWSTISSWTG